MKNWRQFVEFESISILFSWYFIMSIIPSPYLWWSAVAQKKMADNSDSSSESSMLGRGVEETKRGLEIF